MSKQFLARLGTVVLSLTVLALCLWALVGELHAYDYRQVWHSLVVVRRDRLLAAFLFTALGYWAMTGYDVLALYSLRHLLPYPKTALAAFTSIAISNSVGLAFLSSSAIRYRLYSTWGLSKLEVAQVIAFGHLSFWLGMLAIGGVLFLVEPLTVPELLNLPFVSVHPLGAIFLALALGYLVLSVLSRRKTLRWGDVTFKLPSPFISSAQIAISAFDWALAAAVLYLLFPPGTQLSYPAFFGIYLLSQFTGIVSNVPGGLGVFETIMLLLLSPIVPGEQILAALLTYRGIYYFLPLGTAILFLVSYEVRGRVRSS